MEKEQSSQLPLVEKVEKPLITPDNSVGYGPYAVAKDEDYGWLVTFNVGDGKWPILHISDRMLFVDCIAIVVALNGAYVTGRASQHQ